MTQFSLTAQQAKLLDFITTSINEAGIAPSYESMAAHLGIVSRSNVAKLISNLEARGRIKRIPHKARSIALASSLATVPAYELMAELRSRGIEVKVVTA